MSSRESRYRLIAATITEHPEYSYDQVADIAKIDCKPQNKRQVIYSYLQRPRLQTIMTELQHKIYDEEYLKRKVTTAIEETKPKDAVHGKYLELGMKNLAMLTDKTINENRNYDATELDKIREKALQEAEESLKSVLPGAETAPQTEQASAEIEPKQVVEEKSGE